MLTDRYGRFISYLRISVTDRCNLRCVYCMPPEGVPWKSHDSMLRYEEIEQVVRVMAQMGLRKVRLTGGEPLVRPHLCDLVRMIAAIPQIEDISLTTNGMLLEDMASDLARAGLKRINISLDTLNDKKFNTITRRGSLEKVWRGVEAAEASGLTPVKINAVAMRGVNDDELLDMARLTLEHSWHMRFIELMPVNNQGPWEANLPKAEDVYMSTREIMDLLRPLNLQPAKNTDGRGPAKEYRIPGGRGIVGFISPVSDHFCASCNRLRLTADGNLRLCLLHDVEIPLLPALRAGEPILPLIEEALHRKPRGHELAEEHLPTGRTMMQIGG